MCRKLAALLLLLGLVAPPSAIAAGPDYDLPGRFALPWECGQGHRITWDPAGHWECGKATGIAFDFSMEEGSPLFAPADGAVYFLRDERPFETNLGNYVELVVDGGWLVRLAHLRDPQSGERMVSAGELIGHSGSTGVPTPHLHLELLVRTDQIWGRPDLERLNRFFGRPMADFVQDAIITNDGCPAQLALDGPVCPVQEITSLGEPVDLTVPLRNEGLEPTVLRVVQVALLDPFGAQLLAEAQGEWPLGAKTAVSIALRAWPNLAGNWRVKRVTCQTQTATFTLDADGHLEVAPSPLKLVGVTCSSTLDVGDPIALEAWVENSGDQDLALDDLQVGGGRPDGVSWSASVGHQVLVPAGSVRQIRLTSPTVPQKVGQWEINQIGFQRDGRLFLIARPLQAFAVVGPELVVDRLAAYTLPGALHLFLVVSNAGTRSAAPERLEAWGWKPDGEGCFTLIAPGVAPLAPGESALIQMVTEQDGAEGTWSLVEVGYWLQGQYHGMSLPDKPAILVEGDAARTPDEDAG